MRVAVTFSWSSLGDVGLDAGRLVFPPAPERAGIYRFDLGDRVYVGETDRLRRRFQHYRTPGPSQRTNLRLNQEMLEVLDRGGRVAVSVVLEATIDVDEDPASLDLTVKSARRLVESAAETAARLEGLTVANL